MSARPPVRQPALPHATSQIKQARLTIIDEADSLSRNVGNNYQHTLRNNPEERKFN